MNLPPRMVCPPGQTLRKTTKGCIMAANLINSNNNFYGYDKNHTPFGTHHQ